MLKHPLKVRMDLLVYCTEVWIMESVYPLTSSLQDEYTVNSQEFHNKLKWCIYHLSDFVHSLLPL